MRSLIPLTKPWLPADMKENILKDISKVIDSGKLILGANADLLESSFASLTESNEAISVSSATTALQIVLRYANVAGGEVIVPAASFITDVSAIQMESAKPILVDIDKETLTFDLEDLKNKINPNTRAIIWIHLVGYIGKDYKKIQDIAKQNNIFLIEDCSHAHGAKIDNKPAGSLGDAGIFSFYPTKILTSGTGGIITTNNKKLAKTARSLRVFGKDSETNEVVLQGNDWILDEFRCSICYNQFLFLENNLKIRRNIAKKYISSFKEINCFKLLKIPENIEPSWYQFPIFLNDNINPLAISNYLIEAGISTKKIYKPVNEEKIFEEIYNDNLIVAKKTLDSSICLPMYVDLSNSDQDYIIEKIVSKFVNL